MILRNIIVRLLDIFYREPHLKRRILNEKHSKIDSFLEKSFNNNHFIFMVDGRVHHGGMFDRLKGAITVYAIAKALGKEFKIDWSYPFHLDKYLEPVKKHNNYICDWRTDEQQMTWQSKNFQVVIAYGEFANPARLWKNRNKEALFYYGYDSLNEVNAHFGTNYDWGMLYRELFKPTTYLQSYLDAFQKEIGSEYIAIHTRWLNLLGDKVEYTDINPELESAESKNILMNAAVVKIKELFSIAKSEDPSIRLMIASDSMTFINYIKREIANIYVVPGTVKHIDTAGETDDSENIKMFTDYYLIAHSKKVYSLWHEGMWKSAFPEYAAKIGGVPFERMTF